MDFDVFMERYGYKLLLGLFAAVFIVIVLVLIASFYMVLKILGYFAGILVIVLVIVYAFTVKRKVMDSYAQAHAKYFYDDRPKR